MSGDRPSFAFDRETAIEPVGPGRYSTFIHPDWNIDTNPNGGYAISAMVAAARVQRPDHPDPVAVTTQFLKSPTADRPALITLEEVKVGRRIAFLRLTLIQDDVPRATMLATMADLASGTEPGDGQGAPRSIDDLTPPEIASPRDCADRSELNQGVTLPLLSRVDVRIDPRYLEPGTVGSAELVGWIRLSDGRPTDVGCLPLFADAFPPSVFSLWGMIGWVPTVELTVHVRRRPASGWVLGRFTTRDLTGGTMIEDGTLWDEDGRLVARSRQLALVFG